MGNTELYKGQTDGIILFILTKGNRHTDELKQIIDEKFSTVKIGTIYSIITRLKNQKLISEYRASSIDGSRRKYYQLTEMGLRTFNDKYFDAFKGVFIEEEIKTPTLKNETTSNDEVATTIEAPIEVDDKASSYASYISETTSEDLNNIDFSAFEQEISPTNNETASTDSLIEDNIISDSTPENEAFSNEFIPYLQPTIKPNVEDEINTPINSVLDKDYDSVINSQYDYKSVLDKLYPKPKVEKVEIFEENTGYEEPTDNVNAVDNKANWNDVYELAERDGIKIRVSSDTNRYQGSKILINKLTAVTSAITLAIVLLSYLLMIALFSSGGVKFKPSQFFTLFAIFGIICVISLLAYLFMPHKQIKDLPRFINVFEITLIITISTIIIAFAMSAIVEIDYKNMALVFDNLILPSVMSFSLPLFFIIEYLLSKLDFFQSY